MVFFLFPFLWMLIVSLKPDPELYNLKAFPFWIKNPTFSHITYLFNKTSFLIWE